MVLWLLSESIDFRMIVLGKLRRKEEFYASLDTL